MRRLRFILTWASALLCAAAAAMWVRSHHAGEVIGREGLDRTGFVASFHGIFSGGGQLAFGTLTAARRDGLPEENTFVDRVPVRWRWRWARTFMPVPALNDAGSDALARAGFGTRSDAAGPEFRRRYRGVGVPYWLVVTVTGALPTHLACRHVATCLRRAHREMAGCCVACGYDLRSSAAQCPECGNRRA
jgi:hypothetical protein